MPNTRFDEVAEAARRLRVFVITDATEATPLADARDRFFDTHQTWMREPATGFWRFDVFREPSDGDTWICRREPAIRMPYARLIEWTDDGIPYGRPEVVLLFKAKHAQLEKNERDFAATLPRLDARAARVASRRARARASRARVAGRAVISIDRARLVDLALRLVSTPSFTGSEEAAAELMRDELDSIGLQTQWQQVEDGRANVLGTWAGAGGGPTLMFNGHLDTSYSGREPWLQGIPGFQPEGFERDGRIYGLGISNMKGAVACYVEAVRALQDAGVRLRGDVLIAAVAGEIEKTQQGDAQGAEYRGYAAGSRYLVTHGGVADMCILGEPTENKLVLAHFGSLWLRLSTHGPFVHTAFSAGRREENSILRMRAVLDAVLEWLPRWEEEMSYGDVRGVANVGAIEGGFGWRVSRTPHRTDLFLDLRVPPDVPMADARRKALEFARSLDGVDAEVYVTAPGAEIDAEHPLVGALDEAHEEVFGAPPESDVTRWFSDASVLTRYGIADRELRHVLRAAGRRAGRESRHRRARARRRRCTRARR